MLDARDPAILCSLRLLTACQGKTGRLVTVATWKEGNLHQHVLRSPGIREQNEQLKRMPPGSTYCTFDPADTADAEIA